MPDKTLTYEPEDGRGVPHVYVGMHQVQSALASSGIAKDRKNEQQGFKYRGVDDAMNALAPELAAAKILVLPEMLTHERAERTNLKGTVIFSVLVQARFTFVSAVDGSHHSIVVYGEAMDSGDKATNKAMSVAFKYAMFLAFCIPTAGDNDPDATVHEVLPKITPPPRTTDPTAHFERPVGEAPPNTGPVISDPQRKRMYAIAKQAGYSDDEFRLFVEGWGFASSKDITKAKYEAMCKALEAPDAASETGL
jgi:hypothetical protein